MEQVRTRGRMKDTITMEHIHGIDVSWMTHGNPKDKSSRPALARQRSLSNSAARDPSTATTTTSTLPSLSRSPSLTSAVNGIGRSQTETITIPPRPIFVRTPSEQAQQQPPVVTPPQRRGSWFSNISSKFSSTGNNSAAQSPPQASNASPKPAELSVPKANPAKNAVLQHAAKPDGEGPYTPAPPKSSQANGLLHVFRRLSSSNGNLAPNFKSHNHGLVERKVLNVDQRRERCEISGLNQAKLRRVAFCVDVEIAPMPKYNDELGEKKVKDNKKKPPATTLAPPDNISSGTEPAQNEPPEASPVSSASSVDSAPGAPAPQPIPTPQLSAAEQKKRDKKKKSEEERKARKEKKRKQAEVNGSRPMELYCDSDSSASGSINAGGTPASTRPPQTVPTTNPVRIYRRCCQLRETPILKKITEQLMDAKNFSADTGMVEKLDLASYWMQLSDLVTLGDYLAVVPVREVILESCGLNDEGLRVVLAGLLAVRRDNSFSLRKTAARKSAPIESSAVINGGEQQQQGGVVERLVLKNNKIGTEGWRHICLFVYLCRTIKCLDLSGIRFPRFAQQLQVNGEKQAVCQLLSRSLGERLGGSTLSLLSMGETGLSTEQLGAVIDGVIRCGVKRLGLAHNDIDAEGLGHVARFLKSNICEGLDLGGNDLRENIEILAGALVVDECPLWALSLADCNLVPPSLCKIFPTLVKLQHLRFIDLSHNHELFSSDPSAVGVLRRYLPKMSSLKRIHLTDCTLSAEQAIALAEILPEITGLAHVSFLENKQLIELATNANSEEKQEEACALFASLLAAARVSTSLVAVDIEVPSEQSSDLVKAMAKQVVAYGLRNMEAATSIQTTTQATAGDEAKPEPEYPDVLQRLVGHDVTLSTDADPDVDAAPDDDYVIGGTGVVKALACCLKNRGDNLGPTGEFLVGVGSPQVAPANAGKAKETSKHLLLSARKIRLRLQPAIVKARLAANDSHTYHRLMFLDNTLNGIIKRFEDEFPDTRLSFDSAVELVDVDSLSLSSIEKGDGGEGGEKPPIPTLVATDSDLTSAAIISDNEDEGDHFSIKNPIKKALSRSNSIISLTSKALADEEARVLRAGHRFRAGIVRPEHYALLTSGVEEVGADPNHARLLHELLDEMGDDQLKKDAETRGVVTVFQEQKDNIMKKLQEQDPAHWQSFVEAQEMARKNVKPTAAAESSSCSGPPRGPSPCPVVIPKEGELAGEVAVED